MSWRGMHIFEEVDDLYDAAATGIGMAMTEALRHRELATLVLTGGRTAQGVYLALAEDRCRPRIDWSRVHVFWGDERAVPPDHPDSNFLMADRTLLSNVPVPKENVHRIAGEMAAEQAATLYELEIRRVVAGEPPIFDLILLSMGEDGHIASLFPGMKELDEDRRLALPVTGPKPPPSRVSLTLRVINAARNITVLAAGSLKAAAVARAHDRTPQPGRTRLPVSLLEPDRGRLTWMVDRAAASELNDQIAKSG